MRKTTKLITIWGGTLLSLVLAYFALRKVEWSQTWVELQHTHWPNLVIAFILMWLGFLWRVIRWKRLIDTGQKISFKDCFTVIVIGYMANNILPARIGELVRAYLLSRKNGISKSFAFGTIVLERLGDVLMLVTLICLTLIILPLPLVGKKVIFGSVTIGIIGVVSVTVAVLFGRKIYSIIYPLLRRIIGESYAEVLSEKIDHFLVGISGGKSLRTLGLICWDSLGIWMLSLAMTWEVALACNIKVEVSQILFVMCFVNLGAMLPSAPGYVGTYQWFCMFALGIFGINKESSLAFSIVSHIIWYLPLTLVGLILFLREKLTWKQISIEQIPEAVLETE